MRRALVTGCCGFIGTALTLSLLERGVSVVGCDSFDSYYPRERKQRNLRELTVNGDLSFHEGDVTDKEFLRKIIREIDVVFHLAARPGIFQSFSNPEDYFRINVNGTLNILLASREAKVDKVVFASSSAIYGMPKVLPISEGHSAEPDSPYGLSKKIAEEYCFAFDRLFNLKTVILRYFSVYGPRQRPDLAIAEWTEKIFKTGRVDVKGLQQHRDFTFVKDVTEATIRAAETSVHGEAFNIASGRKVPVRYVLEKLIDLVGVGRVDVENLGMRKGDRLQTHADIQKARHLLGWSPLTSIDQGLEQYVTWYKSSRTD